MRCPACGVQIPDDATYCHRCGTRVADPGTDAPQSSAPPTTASQVSPTPAQPESPYATASPQTAFQQLAARADAGRRNDDEVELWEGTFSWKGMAGEFAIGFLLSVAAVIGALLYSPDMQTLSWIGVAILLGWFVLGGFLLYRRFAVHYRVTSQRFVHQKGVFRRVTDRIEMIDIDDVRLTEGIVERMLGTGTILLRSSDTTHPELSLRGIDNVRDVANLIDTARRDERVRRGLHIEAV